MNNLSDSEDEEKHHEEKHQEVETVPVETAPVVKRRGRPRKRTSEAQERLRLKYAREDKAKKEEEEKQARDDKEAEKHQYKLDKDTHLRSLKVRELKDICRERGLKLVGNKSQLVSYIKGDVKHNAGYMICEPAKKEEMTMECIPSDISRTPYHDLKKYCRIRGLSCTGKMSELRARLHGFEIDSEIVEDKGASKETVETEQGYDKKVERRDFRVKRDGVVLDEKEEKEEKQPNQDYSDVRHLMYQFKTDMGTVVKAFQLKGRHGNTTDADVDGLVDSYNKIHSSYDDAICDLLDDIVDVEGVTGEYSVLNKSYTNFRSRIQKKVEALIS
jgi:hypothetical protein